MCLLIYQQLTRETLINLYIHTLSHLYIVGHRQRGTKAEAKRYRCAYLRTYRLVNLLTQRLTYKTLVDLYIHTLSHLYIAGHRQRGTKAEAKKYRYAYLSIYRLVNLLTQRLTRETLIDLYIHTHSLTYISQGIGKETQRQKQKGIDRCAY